MPQLGETVAEGKILTWFKKIGDAVAPGDRLFEVETDKVTIDVEAIASGIITAIAVGDARRRRSAPSSPFSTAPRRRPRLRSSPSLP